MTTRILDAGVAVAWYLREACSEKALRWQRRMASRQVRFLVPRLHYLEVANVFRTHVRQGEITPATACSCYALHLEAPLDIADPAREDILATALEYEATAYDAVYIALALAHDAPIVTAERATTPWVAKLGSLAEPL